MTAAKKTAAKKTAAKKTAAKKTAASSEATSDQQAEARTQTATAQPGAVSPAANSGDSGPGTQQPQPKAEEGVRPPSTSVVAPSSGPIKAPSDAKEQAQPKSGNPASSTDHTYAAAGGRTLAGETHVGLVDEDGKKVSKSSLFADEDGKTYVTAKQRVFEVFTYPNTDTESKRLLFVPGQRVNRAEAARIEATLD